METYEALRRRRMVRAFEDREVPREALARVLEAGRRAPSAGFSQGVDLLVLETAGDREAFWEAATDAAWRAAHPRHEQTRRAPVIVMPLTGPGPYVERYSEPDKAGSGLDEEAGWPVPFWWVDAGCAVMAMLVAAVDEGLGAQFTMISAMAGIRVILGLPEHVRVDLLIPVGYPAPGPPVRGSGRPVFRVHRNQYGR